MATPVPLPAVPSVPSTAAPVVLGDVATLNSAGTFQLTYSVTLDKTSMDLYNQTFAQANAITVPGVGTELMLLAKVAAIFSTFKTSDGTLLNSSQQASIVRTLFKQLNAVNPIIYPLSQAFVAGIDSTIALRNGEFDVDFGSGGCGCLPCFSKAKIEVML